jgi:lysozyme
MSYQDILIPQLRIDEGVRYVLYTDSRGVPTYGCGHNAHVPITDAAVNQILMDDVAVAEVGARRLFPCFDQLSEVRQAVVMNMTFNLGEETLSTFTTFIGLVNSGDYAAAAQDMLGTAWAAQVGERAIRLSTAMREG